MPVEKICVICNKPFSVPPCRAETATTCSHECAVFVRAKSRERKITCKCGNCGKTFEIPQSHKDRRVYCSKECQYSSDKFRSDISDRYKGENNPMWKGGEHNHKEGYVYTLARKHPFATPEYIFKHRLIMEEWLKECDPGSKFLVKLGVNLYLSPDFDVHHLDFDKSHNERKNLIVLTKSAHSMLHNGNMPSPGSYWPVGAKIVLPVDTERTRRFKKKSLHKNTRTNFKP